MVYTFLLINSQLKDIIYLLLSIILLILICIVYYSLKKEINKLKSKINSLKGNDENNKKREKKTNKEQNKKIDSESNKEVIAPIVEKKNRKYIFNFRPWIRNKIKISEDKTPSESPVIQTNVETDEDSLNLKDNVFNKIIKAAVDNLNVEFPKFLISKIITEYTDGWKREFNIANRSINELNNPDLIIKESEDIISDIKATITNEYYIAKEISSLINKDNFYNKISIEKTYPNLDFLIINKIIENNLSSLQAEMINVDFIHKRELDSNFNNTLLNIKNQLLLENNNRSFKRMFSPPPTMEACFLDEKLSQDQDTSHTYYIDISQSDKTSAIYNFLYDNEKAVNTAIQSFSSYLEPVCEIENDETTGNTIIPVSPNGGKLKLENGKWIVTEKLKIKII